MTITLRHDAECAECKAILPAGTRARWYRDGKVYGSACHRWRVEGLSPARQRALARAAEDVLKAAAHNIPAAVLVRIAALGPATDKSMNKGTYDFLIAELRAIAQEIQYGC